MQISENITKLAIIFPWTYYLDIYVSIRKPPMTIIHSFNYVKRIFIFQFG